MKTEIQKLEILPQFKKLHGEKIHKDLESLKYCQSLDEAYIELIGVTNHDDF